MAAEVLVAHPALQHAHQLALALHERLMLRCFCSGVPIAAAGDSLPWWLPDSYQRKIKRVEIPAPLRMHPMRFQALLRAGVAFGANGARTDRAHRVFHWFDAWMARRILRLRPKVVVAYENSAFLTFQAAKNIGALCVLDAPSVHHRSGAVLMDTEVTPYTPEINRRKDEEVRLADLILTCSPFAANTYVDNGVSASKVHALLLGAELPGDMAAPQKTSPSAHPRFVFAGALSRRKSIDLIVAAFRRLHQEGLRYELQFVGGVAEPDLLAEVLKTPDASHHAGVAQQDLFPMLAAADCLLLPSRFDSFGMVVAEAMACGTPALVSTQTGAKALIEALPGSGWVVEPTLDSLHLALQRLLRDPTLLHAARNEAIKARDQFSWNAYRRRAGDLFEELVC